MKRLLTLTLAGLALALPAAALADTYVLTHLGSNVSSRAATGSCVTRMLTGSVVLRCDGSTGYAVARYDFKMPDSWCGTAGASVNAFGSPVVPTVVKLDATHVRVIVRISGGPSKVVISSVSVGFHT